MAIVLGTSSGFVTVAPSDDPGGGTTTVTDNYVMATKHVSPANGTLIVEMGWYKDSGAYSSNYELGLYADSEGVPGALLYGTSDAASGTAMGNFILESV